jgi:hypothetical protein
VVASVDARVVQRGLLDQLQGLPGLEQYLQCPTSFGGIPGKGVGSAIDALKRVLPKHKFFIRSDIQSFFTKIPKALAFEQIRPLVDPKTQTLLDQACTSELSNADELGELVRYFPSREIGAPQGLCLSPLFGNIILHEFDVVLNRGDAVCFRYVDDFLILAPSEKLARALFKQAQEHLSNLCMAAYDPSTSPEKAEEGLIKDGFEFLGVAIQPGLVRPTRSATQKIVNSVEGILRDAKQHLAKLTDVPSKAHGLQRVLYDVSSVLEGWRGSYQFCDQPFVFRDLDVKIDSAIGRFLREYGKQYRQAPPAARRRMLGIPVLTDPWKDRGRANRTSVGGRPR